MVKEFDVTAVGRGNVRLDLIDPEPEDLMPARFCRIIDLDTARILTIMLIEAIKIAEVEATVKRKGKKK